LGNTPQAGRWSEPLQVRWPLVSGGGGNGSGGGGGYGAT